MSEHSSAYEACSQHRPQYALHARAVSLSPKSPVYPISPSRRARSRARAVSDHISDVQTAGLPQDTYQLEREYTSKSRYDSGVTGDLQPMVHDPRTIPSIGASNVLSERVRTVNMYAASMIYMKKVEGRVPNAFATKDRQTERGENDDTIPATEMQPRQSMETNDFHSREGQRRSLPSDRQSQRSLDSLPAAYFDAVAGLRQVDEEIEQLNFDFEEDALERDRLLSSEQPMIMSDEEFQATFLRELDQLQLRRTALAEEASRLETECIAAQYDLERLRWRGGPAPVNTAASIATQGAPERPIEQWVDSILDAGAATPQQASQDASLREGDSDILIQPAASVSPDTSQAAASALATSVADVKHPAGLAHGSSQDAANIQATTLLSSAHGHRSSIAVEQHRFVFPYVCIRRMLTCEFIVRSPRLPPKLLRHSNLDILHRKIRHYCELLQI